MNRCDWCGRFIAKDTPVTTHKGRGVRNGHLRWRRFYHRLCPDCSKSASIVTPWWQP